MIEDLVLYLRSQNVSGIGSNVFAYSLRMNDIGAFITPHTAGFLANNEIPDTYRGTIQVVVRANNIKDAQDQAQALSDVLSSSLRRANNNPIGIALPSAYIKYLYPRHAPVVYPRSDGNFYEASVNFDICFVAVSG